MNNIFTAEEISTLSAEIDQQLQEVKKTSLLDIKTVESTETNELPVKQSQAIAKTTQEDPKTFLEKFLTVAQKDLCEKGGVLYDQWKRWADLNNKDVIDKFAAILVGLGFTGNAVQILVVAVSVIVIHLGVKTFCEYYSI